MKKTVLLAIFLTFVGSPSHAKSGVAEEQDSL